MSSPEVKSTLSPPNYEVGTLIELEQDTKLWQEEPRPALNGKLVTIPAGTKFLIAKVRWGTRDEYMIGYTIGGVKFILPIGLIASRSKILESPSKTQAD